MVAVAPVVVAPVAAAVLRPVRVPVLVAAAVLAPRGRAAASPVVVAADAVLARRVPSAVAVPRAKPESRSGRSAKNLKCARRRRLAAYRFRAGTGTLRSGCGEAPRFPILPTRLTRAHRIW